MKHFVLLLLPGNYFLLITAGEAALWADWLQPSSGCWIWTGISQIEIMKTV